MIKSVKHPASSQYFELAKKLREETQIPYKYFEIDNLLLINISLSEDPNRYQEYALYRQKDDGFVKIESITVNSPSSSTEQLSALLVRLSKQRWSAFEVQIRAFNEKLTFSELEDFKKRFQLYEARY